MDSAPDAASLTKENILEQTRKRLRPNVDAELNLQCTKIYTDEKRKTLIDVALVICKIALRSRHSSTKEKICSWAKRLYEKYSYNNLVLFRDIFVDSIAILNPHIEPLSALICNYITEYEYDLKHDIFEVELPKKITEAFNEDKYGNLKAYLHFISCFVTYGSISPNSYVALLDSLASQIPNVSISRKEAIARVVTFACKTCSTEVEEDDLDNILSKVKDYISDRGEDGYFSILNPLRDGEICTCVDTLYNSSRQENLLTLFEGIIRNDSSNNQTDFPSIDFVPSETDKSSYPIFFLPFRDSISEDRYILQEFASDLIAFCGNDWQLLKDQLLTLPLILETDESPFCFKDDSSLEREFSERTREYINIIINAAISDVCRIPSGYKEMPTCCHVLSAVLLRIVQNSSQGNREIFLETFESYFEYICRDLPERLSYMAFSRLTEFFALLLSVFTIRDVNQEFSYMKLLRTKFWKDICEDLSSNTYGALFVREILRILARTNSQQHLQRILLSGDDEWDAIFPPLYFRVMQNEDVKTDEKYLPGISQITKCLNEERDTFENTFNDVKAKTCDYDAAFALVSSIIEMGLAETNVSGYFDSIKNYIIKYMDEFRKVFNEKTIQTRYLPLIDPVVMRLKSNDLRPVLIQTLIFFVTQKLISPNNLLEWFFFRLNSVDENLVSESDQDRKVESIGEFIDLWNLYCYMFECLIEEYISPRKKSNLDVESARNMYRDFLVKVSEQFSPIIEERFQDTPEMEWVYLGSVSKIIFSHLDVFTATYQDDVVSMLTDNKVKELVDNINSLNN